MKSIIFQVFLHSAGPTLHHCCVWNTVLSPRSPVSSVGRFLSFFVLVAIFHRKTAAAVCERRKVRRSTLYVDRQDHRTAPGVVDLAQAKGGESKLRSQARKTLQPVHPDARITAMSITHLTHPTSNTHKQARLPRHVFCSTSLTTEHLLRPPLSPPLAKPSHFEFRYHTTVLYKTTLLQGRAATNLKDGDNGEPTTRQTALL